MKIMKIIKILDNGDYDFATKGDEEFAGELGALVRIVHWDDPPIYIIKFPGEAERDMTTSETLEFVQALEAISENPMIDN